MLIKKLAVPAALAAILLMAVTAASANTSSRSSSQLTTSERTAAIEYTIRAAAFDNPSVDPDTALTEADQARTWPSNVKKARAVVTDRGTAVELMGSPGAAPESDVGRRVILIEVTGDFVARGWPRPKGAKEGTGRFLVFAIDPSSGQPVDWGLAPSRMNLDSMPDVETWFTTSG